MAGRPRKLTKEQIAAAEAALWAEIRLAYETQGAKLRELARQFGIKSHATISRRVEAEGWLRNEAATSAHFATQGVLDELELQEKAARKAIVDNAVNQQFNQKNPASNGEVPNRQPALTPGSTMEPEQAATIKSAQKLARAQQAQLLKEIAGADLVIGASTQLLETLQKVMKMEDPGEIVRLLLPYSLTGKMESFSSLMRSAIGGIKDGVNLRRRALGMDMKFGYGQTTASQGVSQEDLPEQVRNLIPQMSNEQLLELRRAAEMLNNKIQIEGPRGGGVVIDLEFEDVTAPNGA